MKKRMSVLALLVVALALTAFTYGAVFQDFSQSDFNNGTHFNTTYNGSAVLLGGGNTSGLFVSRVFNATAPARWLNLTWNGGEPSVEVYLIVDNNADIWRSLNFGNNWSLFVDDFNGGDLNSGILSLRVNSTGSLFIIRNKEVWASNDFGESWTMINDNYSGEGQSPFSFEIGVDDELLITEGGNEIFLSIDSGNSFLKVNASFKGTASNVAGIAVNSSGSFFVVDNGAEVHVSNDKGTTWFLVNDDFNGGTGDNANDMASNSSDALYVVDRQDVWVSTDNGANWILVNDDFNGGADGNNAESMHVDSQDNIIIIDGSEDAYFSSDEGVTFTAVASNINAPVGDAMPGITSFYLDSSLLFSVQNCTLGDCSDGTWQDVDLLDFNLTGQYFRYRVVFDSPDSSVSPFVENVSVFYELLNSAPVVLIDFPINGSYFSYNSSIELNYSVSDENLDSCWYNLNGGANQSLSNCGNTTIDVSEGFHIVTVYANDSFGEVSGDIIVFTSDLTFPLASFDYPVDSVIYDFVVQELNYSVSDENLDSCWYSLNGGETNQSVVCGENVAGVSSDEGNNEWTLWVNDSAGNENSSSVVFYQDTLAPSVSIYLPGAGNVYGFNESISLNYSVSDENLDSCWYNLNGGANQSLSNCGNTTIDVPEGNNTLRVYANDTLGHEDFSEVNFSVVLGAPTVFLISPVNNAYQNNANGNYTFVYQPEDLDLESCELWGDFNGTFGLNQTDNFVVSGAQSSFVVPLLDGNYTWEISCNDTVGNVATTNARTLFVDTINPSLSISSPTGTVTTRSEIPLTFSVIDASPTTCTYNVFRGSFEEVTNASFPCSLGGTSFDVTLDADFVLNLYVNDSAGNSKFTNVSFSVNTNVQNPDPEIGGGGGGGGGGGSSFAPADDGEIDLDFSHVDDFVLKQGTVESFRIELTNEDRNFLNVCKLEFDGVAGAWMENDEIKGLSPGEKFSYAVRVSAPREGEPGAFNAIVRVLCQEGNISNSITVTAYRNSFEAELLDYSREGNELVVRLELREYSGEDHNLIIDYEMLDLDEIARFRNSLDIFLGARESRQEEIRFDLPKDSFGEFIFRAKFSNSVTETEDTLNVFLPSQTGLTGLAISDDNRRSLSYLGIGVVVLIFLIVGASLFRRFRRKTKKIEVVKKKKGGRRLLEFEL